MSPLELASSLVIAFAVLSILSVVGILGIGTVLERRRAPLFHQHRLDGSIPVYVRRR